jgi:hypothetical protein
MSKLGSEAQALVEAGRGLHRPTTVDRQRVLEALRDRIAQTGGLPPEPAPPPPSPAPRVRTWQLISGVVVGAAIIGAIAFQLRGTDGPPPPAPVSTPAPSTFSTTPPAPVVVTAPSEPPPLSTPPAPTRPPTENKAPPARAVSSGRAGEVALLSRAETELHANRFGSALRLLSEYERKFPRGLMVQEDVAAKVQALCGLGRIADAKVELARLSPTSPHAHRARAACRLE